MSERGSIAAFVAVLGFAFIATLGLVADGGRVLNARRSALHVAQSAARAGATELVVTDLQNGRVVVDPAAALRRAQALAADHHMTATITVNGSVVTVTTASTVHLPILDALGVGDRLVTAAASADAVRGVTQEEP